MAKNVIKMAKNVNNISKNVKMSYNAKKADAYNQIKIVLAI